MTNGSMPNEHWQAKSMKSRSPFLIISIGILCVFGLRSASGLFTAFVPHDYGEFTQAARIGGIIGTFTAVLVYFGLAYAQWSTRGKWGLGIAIFSSLLFVMQSFLTYLAVSSGRVSLSTFVVVRFIIFTVIGALALGISSFISYSQRPKENA
jgi:hypothetical protein